MFNFLNKKKKKKEKGKIIPQVKLLARDPKPSPALSGQYPIGDKAKSEVAPSEVGPSGRKSKITTVAGQAKDPAKRQRLWLLAFAVVLALLILKLVHGNEWAIRDIVLCALGAAVLAYGGVILAFKFDVHRYSYFTVLPQAAMFTFGAVLFLGIFFFQPFARIYQSVLFVAVLVAFWIILSGVFLTANVLNVSKVKPIPLLKVAPTI